MPQVRLVAEQLSDLLLEARVWMVALDADWAQADLRAVGALFHPDELFDIEYRLAVSLSYLHQHGDHDIGGANEMWPKALRTLV